MGFLRNIVNDLWERRLMPVVALLAVAAIAIPVFVPQDERPAKPVSSSGKGKEDTGSGSSTGSPLITLEQQPKSESLDAFQQKDPFIQQGLGELQNSGSVTPADTGAITGTDASSMGSSTDFSSTPSSDSYSAPDTSSSSSTPFTSTPTYSESSTTTVVKYYRWSVTVSFGRVDNKKKKIDGMMALRPLPTSKWAVITYIGVARDPDYAVFAVSPGVIQDGEGSCKPSKKQCDYVYLRKHADHNEHTFTSLNDHKYKLKLTEIDLVAGSKKFSEVKGP